MRSLPSRVAHTCCHPARWVTRVVTRSSALLPPAQPRAAAGEGWRHHGAVGPAPAWCCRGARGAAVCRACPTLQHCHCPSQCSEERAFLAGRALPAWSSEGLVPLWGSSSGLKRTHCPSGVSQPQLWASSGVSVPSLRWLSAGGLGEGSSRALQLAGPRLLPAPVTRCSTSV